MCDGNCRLRAALRANPLPVQKHNPPKEEEKVVHASGATSGSKVNLNFLPTGEGQEVTCLRFQYGNDKHEGGNTVYAEANWLKAYHAKDLKFFRERAAHAEKHLQREMRGDDDPNPGGNLGGVGWWVDVMAFVKKNDPRFYGAIQGKWKYEPKEEK